MLTVQSPHSLSRNVLQLGGRHFAPLMGWVEVWPFLEQHNLIALDSKPDAQSVTHGQRHTGVAERGEPLHHLGLLDLRQHHLDTPWLCSLSV